MEFTVGWSAVWGAPAILAPPHAPPGDSRSPWPIPKGPGSVQGHGDKASTPAPPGGTQGPARWERPLLPPASVPPASVPRKKASCVSGWKMVSLMKKLKGRSPAGWGHLLTAGSRQGLTLSCKLDQILLLLGRGHATLWPFYSVWGVGIIKGYLEVSRQGCFPRTTHSPISTGHFLHEYNRNLQTVYRRPSLLFGRSFALAIRRASQVLRYLRQLRRTFQWANSNTDFGFVSISYFLHFYFENSLSLLLF